MMLILEIMVIIIIMCLFYSSYGQKRNQQQFTSITEVEIP